MADLTRYKLYKDCIN